MDRAYLREIGFPEEWSNEVFEGRGCKECSETGYLGRLGVYELMLMEEEIRRLTITNADASRLRKQAIENGMVTLRQDGFIKIHAGLTTVAEVIRVTQES